MTKTSTWAPVATEESLKSSDCGNPMIDRLARIKAMQDVWHKLAQLFPACHALSAYIWMARRNGSIRHSFSGTGLEKLLYGPRNQEEWELMAKICVETALNQKIQKEWIYEYLTPAKLEELMGAKNEISS